MGDLDTAVQRTARKLHDIGPGSGTTETLLTDTEITEEVNAAVTQYSVDLPRERVADITGVTSPYFATSSLTGWVDTWSRLLSVEWQAAAVGANYQPTYLDVNEDVRDYQDSSARYLWLPAYTPVSGDTTRFRYTTPHTLDNTTDTIPTPHFDAVCDLAAAFCCTRLQAKFAKSNDSTLAADSVNYRDSQLRFKQAGETFMAAYRRKCALPEGSGPAPAGRIVDWDTDASWSIYRQSDRLIHRRRMR